MNLDIPILLLLSLVFLLLLYLIYRIDQTRKQLLETRKLLWVEVRRETRGLFNQLEAWLSLRDRLDLRQGLPYTANWSASPDFCKLIVEHCLEARPQTILECSSGLTTLMLARCCQLNSQGHVHSLENGGEYAERTRHHINRYGLDRYATVIHAPLEPHSVEGVSYQWYSTRDLPEQPIDMLVIDGPPGFIQRHSRYPALPLLRDRLADGCTIFLDDAARPDEQEIIHWWQKAYPEISCEYIKNERGCAVLTVSKNT